MYPLHYIEHRHDVIFQTTNKISPLSSCLQVMGEDRVVLGTDYPFPLGEHHPGGLIQSTDLSDAVKKKLLYHNALEFLSLQPSKFE